ncbi:MAG TPA: hypothetical protein PKD54_12220 [Pirellulaceae bacterium]|nr:hypothetical protein [Pirellulaceae bacterium]
MSFGGLNRVRETGLGVERMTGWVGVRGLGRMSGECSNEKLLTLGNRHRNAADTTGRRGAVSADLAGSHELPSWTE